MLSFLFRKVSHPSKVFWKCFTRFNGKKGQPAKDLNYQNNWSLEVMIDADDNIGLNESHACYSERLTVIKKRVSMWEIESDTKT